jgi:hypothetical protein
MTLARFASSGAGGKCTLSVRAGGVSLPANLYLEDTQPLIAHTATHASAKPSGARNRHASALSHTRQPAGNPTFWLFIVESMVMRTADRINCTISDKSERGRRQAPRLSGRSSTRPRQSTCVTSATAHRRTRGINFEGFAQYPRRANKVAPSRLPIAARRPGTDRPNDRSNRFIDAKVRSTPARIGPRSLETASNTVKRAAPGVFGSALQWIIAYLIYNILHSTLGWQSGAVSPPS